MSSNARDLNKRMKDRLARLPERVAEQVRKVAVDALATAVELSPVDEVDGGDFKGAWRLTTNPNMGDVDTPDTTGSATIERAKADVEAIEGAVISLINPKPYAKKIENGSSDQAPRGVLGITADRMKARLSQ